MNGKEKRKKIGTFGPGPAKEAACHVGPGRPKVLTSPGCQTGTKGPPLVPDWRSRLGNRNNMGFSTGTTWVSQPGQINVSIVVHRHCYEENNR